MRALLRTTPQDRRKAAHANHRRFDFTCRIPSGVRDIASAGVTRRGFCSRDREVEAGNRWNARRHVAG
jgi:hypothetical protein